MVEKPWHILTEEFKKEIMQITGLYLIINKISGGIYIGSSVHIHRRWKGHRNHLKNNTHENNKLQNSWNKYGADAFELCILSQCSKEELIPKEQCYIDFLGMQNLYNLEPTSKNKLYTTGTTKEKISRAHKGKVLTEEHKAKLSAAKIGKPRAPYTAETCRRISESKKGVPNSPEHNEKVRKSLIGHTRNAAPYLLKDPNGIVHIGNNLKEFADKMNLSYTKLSYLNRGQTKKTYDGWTCV